MTDRIKGFVVTLDGDYRADDVEEIRQAIAMIRGVLDVSPSVRTPEDVMNRQRVRLNIIQGLDDFIRATADKD